MSSNGQGMHNREKKNAELQSQTRRRKIELFLCFTTKTREWRKKGWGSIFEKFDESPCITRATLPALMMQQRGFEGSLGGSHLYKLCPVGQEHLYKRLWNVNKHSLRACIKAVNCFDCDSVTKEMVHETSKQHVKARDSVHTCGHISIRFSRLWRSGFTNACHELQLTSYRPWSYNWGICNKNL